MFNNFSSQTLNANSGQRKTQISLILGIMLHYCTQIAQKTF